MAADDLLKQLTELDDAAIESASPPSQKLVDWLHGKASTQKSEDLHHRLGYTDQDAAQGDHTHDGRNSKALLDAGDLPALLAPGYTAAQAMDAINKIRDALMKIAE